MGFSKKKCNINRNVLKFIKINSFTLEKVGILMPILADVNLKEAY